MLPPPIILYMQKHIQCKYKKTTFLQECVSSKVKDGLILMDHQFEPDELLITSVYVNKPAVKLLFRFSIKFSATTLILNNNISLIFTNLKWFGKLLITFEIFSHFAFSEGWCARCQFFLLKNWIIHLILCANAVVWSIWSKNHSYYVINNFKDKFSGASLKTIYF